MWLVGLDEARWGCERRQEYYVIKKVPLKAKGKFYRSVVRPAMMYGPECWALDKKIK